LIQYNQKYSVLIDEHGLLVPKSDVEELRLQIEKHLSHSPLELEAIARRTVEENHPSMINQFNWEYFK